MHAHSLCVCLADPSAQLKLAPHPVHKIMQARQHELNTIVTELLQEVPRRWLNQPWNFDHLGNALITLFIMATLDSYAGEMGLCRCHALWPMARHAHHAGTNTSPETRGCKGMCVPSIVPERHSTAFANIPSIMLLLSQPTCSTTHPSCRGRQVRYGRSRGERAAACTLRQLEQLLLLCGIHSGGGLHPAQPVHRWVWSTSLRGRSHLCSIAEEYSLFMSMYNAATSWCIA